MRYDDGSNTQWRKNQESHMNHKPPRPHRIAIECHFCEPTIIDPVTNYPLKYPSFSGRRALKRHISEKHKPKVVKPESDPNSQKVLA
jgi:hypothetical protein